VGLEDNFLQESVEGDAVFANGFHVADGINASLLAHSREVVVVGLNQIPVVGI
jgi:hypothetical protein